MWKALANPVRRRILDLLRDGPRTTGALAEVFDDLSRYAVMQHLGVLSEAGLLLVRREGRERFNHLNAVPIQQIHERWVSRFAERDARGMLALRRHLEDKETDMTDEGGRTIRLESEIRLKASPERVWKAITDEQEAWYPYSYGGDRLKAVVMEHGVGGRTYEDWGDGAGILYNTIVYYDPPKVLGTRGFLRPAITLEQYATLEADGDSTILRHLTVTFGPITDEMAEQIRIHGELSAFEDSLRAWVERGERVEA